MRKLIFIILFAASGCSSKGVTSSTGSKCLSATDSVRLKEFYRFSELEGEKLWPGWNNTSLGIILISGDIEYLVGHPKPPADFVKACEIDGLGTVFGRKRQFEPQLLAAFPVFDETPLIVAGTVETTNVKSSTQWLETLLHEHFHQMQYSVPGYYEAVEKIKPAGSKDGSWMLNFPFPYEDSKVQAEFKKLGLALLKASKTKKVADIKNYLRSKKKIESLVGKKNYAYFEFQIWQEGVARYIQIQALKRMVENYSFSPDFRSLADFESAEKVLARESDSIDEALTELDLAKRKRTAFYPIGALEAELLDAVKPQWRSRYFKQLLILEPL